MSKYCRIFTGLEELRPGSPVTVTVPARAVKPENFLKERSIYFLTAPAIAPPRKAMIARYKVIMIYRRNPPKTTA